MMKIQDFHRKIMATSDPFCCDVGLGKVGIEWDVITYGGKSGKWDAEHGFQSESPDLFHAERETTVQFFHFSQDWKPVRVGKSTLKCCHLHASLLPSGFSFGATCHLHNHSGEKKNENQNTGIL